MANKLIIDHDFRIIDIPERKKLLGVQGDIDVNVMEFECPKFYGDVDLSAFSIRINYINAGGEFHQSGDLTITTALNDGETVLNFKWIVGADACSYVGDVRFNVYAYHVTEGSVDKAYHTIVYTLPVVEGLEAGDIDVEEEEP